jgi:quercetin dioxygenase-like cupin family protein
MKLIALCLGLAVTAFLSAAEEPVKVTDESHHRTVLENAQLRILDVKIAVGDTTRYHRHVLPSVVVYLTRSTNRSQTWGEASASPRNTTPGDSRYAPYDDKPLAHRVTNPGPTPFRVFDIELLKAPGDSGRPALHQPNLDLKWEEKRVRSYAVSLPPGTAANIPAANGYLLIGVAGTTTATGGATKKQLNNGDYVFFPPKSGFEMKNTGRDNAELVLLELR